MNFDELLKHIGLEEVHGYDMQVINKRISELKINVPTIFQKYFSKYAATNSVRDSFNRILSPSEWYIQDEKLVFAEENQKVVFWAIDGGVSDNIIEDPKVKVANNSSIIEWFEEELSFSAFFSFLFFYNLIMGTLQNFKKFNINDKQLISLRKDSLCDLYDNGMRIIIKDTLLFAIWIKDNDHTVIANSKSPYSIEQYIKMP